ncbi:glycosyltransferase family 4 protein [Neobacillus vireti]|uniref:Group 1 glycosyl transferase n=1 Tax=Neobacillus vireti LMG 21834 TaxID=1131730 RepID=A0AB94IKF0_9BACI|nr:glycosyltransferase family 4 protein [Neobacillus vireti]ETI67571.1 group 1 glycosyl transferase [Neobacillus vireti LMG 21834]KLT18480.1 glycosyl transferase [Neobacillus vireti]
MHKKVLFCATVDIHFRAFHLPYMKWFKEQGWEVHVAASGDIELPFVDKKYDIPIQRSPFNKLNLKAYKELKKIIDHNQYKIIHCHTPMGGVLTRLAARKARNAVTKVIYTAHGFHFCKGAPIINWALYYPIEKFLSHYTDCLITINQEDYHRALRHRFKARLIKHIHGVGVNTDIFYPVGPFHKSVLRAEQGYKPEDFLMFYAAEFNKNKNQQFLIKALALIKDKVPQIKLLLAGDGPLLEDCKKLTMNLGIEEKVHFLGFRNDIEALLKMSDIAVASSFREGLPVNVMEAMACGLPVIATINRGHSELIQDGKNGYILSHKNSQLFALRLLEMYQSKELCGKMGLVGQSKMKNYSLSGVSSEVIEVYSEYMMEEVNEPEGKHNRAYI